MIPLMLTWLGCFGSCRGTPEPEAPPGDGELLVPGEPGAAALPRELQGKILFVGAENAAPRVVSVQLDRPVFQPSEVGTTPTTFTWKIEPAVEGAFAVAAVDEVRFTPSAPFRPGAHYAITVERQAPSEPAAGPWTRDLDTPEFALGSAVLRRLAPPGGDVVVDLVFSAAVDPRSVRGAVTAKLGDRSLDVSLAPGPEENVVTATVTRPESEADTLAFALAAGRARWSGDGNVTAAAADYEVPLVSGPEMRILFAEIAEGEDGWFVEVLCDDDAAPGEKRWRYQYRWDRGFELSSRCEVDEDFARAMIHADPATELSFAPGDGGFRVFGKFPRGKVKLTVEAGVRTVDGGVTTQSWEKEFTVGARTPRARFADQGRYLPRSAWKNLAVRHLNLESLPVEVRHVPRENLVFWLTGDEPMTERTSNRVAKTSIAVRNPADEEVTSFLSVSSLVSNPKPGVYEIDIDPSGKPGSSARVLLTDMHLVAKGTSAKPGDPWLRKVLVWALDVHTGDALSGVQVQAVRSSGQVLATCSTGGDSGCTLQIPLDPVDDSPPVALVATKGDDLTYIEFADLRLDLPEEVGGEPFTATAAYRAPLWTDRGVYRPGDTAHVSAILRDAKFAAPPADLPVVLRLFDPKEREARKKVVATNAAGLVSADFRFGDYASTGRYRVVAEVGGLSVGEVAFQIEEFVPERLAVTATTLKPGYPLDSEVPVDVIGRWLFGGSASGSRVEVTCRVTPTPFAATQFSGWSFGPAYLTGAPQPTTTGTVEGELDADGKASLVCPAAAPGGVKGPAELVADAAVFEGDTGRTTIGQARARVHPERYYLGIHTPSDKARAGQAMPFKGAVVGWDGAPASGGPKEVTVETFRMEEESSYYYDEGEGTSSSARQLRPAREQKVTVAVTDGRFAFAVTPSADSAGTLVRVKAGNAVTERFVEGVGTRYWWDESAPGKVVDSTPRPLRPTAMRVEAQGPVAVGATVPVTVTAPYPGRILYTVETDDVLVAEWRDAVSGKNEWSFRVDAFHPNVYVSAFLVKDAHLESAEAFLPDRAFGVTSVKIEPSAFTRTLTLTAPEESRPYEPLTVGLQLSGGRGPGFVTVAAVDEGILSLTKFKDPDPLGILFARRGLGVSSYETVGWTRMVAGGGSSSSTGGDAEEAGSAGTRVQMVKPVALWSGVVPLDDSGHAEVKLDVPGYRGKLRVMAVAATPDGIGQASAPVLVRDPLVLMTTLPRFLLAGDTAEIPVRVTNMTGGAREVVVKLEATELQRGAVPDATAGPPLPPPLSFVGDGQSTLAIPPGESKTALFRVRVRPMPGAAHLKVTATGGKFSSKEELDLPIQVARSEVRQVQQVLLSDAKTDLQPFLQGWADGTDKSTLWLTANPYAESLTHLRYLVNYPFG